MVPPYAKEQVLQAFLNDALRLNQEAMECVRQLLEQARTKRVSPAQVRSLGQLVHTLKGTASLVEEAHGVSEQLHALEDQITGKDVLQMARHPDRWLEASRSTLEGTLDFLVRLQRRERYSQGFEPLVKGLVARIGKDLLWFPIASLARIYSPDEVEGSDAVSFEGKLLPVLSAPVREVGRRRFGLAIRSLSGSAVLAVDEVSGAVSWSDAVKLGAEPGMERFEAMLAPAVETAPVTTAPVPAKPGKQAA